MPTLQGVLDYAKQQANIAFYIFLIITAAGIIWKKAWFSGLWILLGFAVFGYFLNTPDSISRISSAVGGLLGW
jgi:hypothetical protein